MSNLLCVFFLGSDCCPTTPVFTQSHLWMRLRGLIFMILLLLPAVPAQSMTLSSGTVPEYIFLEGKKQYEAGNFKAAEDTWSSLHKDPLYGPVASILLFKAFRAQGNLDKSESLLREALQEHPSSVYSNALKRFLVEVFGEQGKPEVAPILTNMLEKAEPKDKPPLILQLAVLERRLENYGKASAHYRDLFLNYPATVEGLQAADDLASLMAKGKIPKPSFSESEQLARAEKLFSRGRFDLAASSYEALLKAKPSDKGLMLKLARCRYKDRRNQSAITILKEILNGNPPENVRMDALYLLSLVYWRLDNGKEFESANTKILEAGSSRLKKKALFNQGAHYYEKGRFSDAKASFERLLKMGPEPKTRISVKWRMAWIKYFTGNYKDAADCFQEVRLILPVGKIQNASKYWQARCLMQLNRVKEAQPLLEQICAIDPLGYYGFESADLLRSIKSSPQEKANVGKVFPDTALTASDNANTRIAHARKLMDMGLHEFALMNLQSVPKSDRLSPSLAFLTAKAAYGAQQYRTAHDFLAPAFSQFMENPPTDAPPDFIEMAFPRVHFTETTRNAEKHGMDPHLVWAVIRQESRYDASAVSPAGALGLMQVTPGAAGIATRGAKVSAEAIANILEPKQNLALGIRILAKNYNTFGGKLVPTVASYNADIRKVREWVSRNGKMKPDEFIENIPFQETRTYVKNVLAGYRAYSLLHRKKDLAGLW